MATNESSALQGKHRHVTECGFLASVVDGPGSIAEHVIIMRSPNADGTATLSTTVPADGAELVEMTFTVLSAGTVTTSGTQQWSISDGTNALATLAATDATTAAGTVVSMTMGSATNNKNLATTDGARLTLTNTEVGTVGAGMEGIWRLVWAL